MAKRDETTYQNNPVLIGLDGLKLLFAKAKSVGIYSIVLTAGIFLLTVLYYAVVALTNASTGSFESQSAVSIEADQASVLANVILLTSLFILYLAFSLLLFGVLDYTAAMLAKNRTTKLGEAFAVVLKNFPSYFFMYLLFILKVLLWSVLFIIPGIIMANRYLLAGAVFFAEDKRGNTALKRSAELTKGAWLTTYGGAWTWNIISQGIATAVFWPGAIAILYRQLADKTDSGLSKPKAHILSWLVLIVPIVLAVLYLLFFALLVILASAAQTSP